MEQGRKAKGEEKGGERGKEKRRKREEEEGEKEGGRRVGKEGKRLEGKGRRVGSGRDGRVCGWGRRGKCLTQKGHLYKLLLSLPRVGLVNDLG